MVVDAMAELLPRSLLPNQDSVTGLNDANLETLGNKGRRHRRLCLAAPSHCLTPLIFSAALLFRLECGQIFDALLVRDALAKAFTFATEPGENLTEGFS
jgi:hypothetical protein